MIRAMTVNEVLDSLGIHRKTIEELMEMTPEERQKYYEENCWSTAKEVTPIIFDLDKSQYDEEGKLLLYFDDRWMGEKRHEQ